MEMFTESYIKKVSKADEIQGLCKYKKGDWFWNGEKPYLYCKSGLGSSNPHEYKWLPTLEDLFGMLDIESFAYIFGDLDNWSGYYFDRGKLQREELKEKVLEYVMNLNYGKDWNPTKKEWEEINGS